jgi:antitoxin MazE
MITAVQKWGNSLALRIPKAYAEESSIAEGSEVNLRVQKGNLIVTPLHKKSYQLSELLKSVSAHNTHASVETGLSIGQEAW